MSAPTEGAATSDSQVQVEWSSVTASGLPTGNSAILSYELLWDNGDSGLTTFLPLTLSSDLATSHTIVGVTEGTYYRFIVRAVNIYGDGLDSTISSIRASDVPSQMSTLTTTRISLDVFVSWVEPLNNGAAVTAYKILVYDGGTSTYVEDLTNCNGALSSTRDALSCSFAFAYLISTYGYSIGELIRFKAQAYNDDGWGELSSANTAGATIMTVPEAMGTPVESTATSSSQIVVTWSALTSTDARGGTAITSYELSWDSGTNGDTWTALKGASPPDTSLTYTESSVTAGDTYQFKLRAQNALGWGDYGPILSVIPSSVPS